MDETERQIGSYRLLERLSGDQWAGAHVLQDRPAVLRRLPHLSAPQRARLAEAVRDLDRLRPPHLEHAHEILDDPDDADVVWLIGERLEGPTLAERIRSRPLPISEVHRLAEALLSGLAVAHAGGGVHGNLSPLQIRFLPQGPCLQGFVTARLEERSWLHMAPELWSRREPRPASDVYALGLCLYEALVGASPFPPGLPRGEYARLHTQQDVPDVRLRRPDVPEPLAALILAITRRPPRERPDALEALRALQAPLLPPVPALAPSSPSPTAPLAASLGRVSSRVVGGVSGCLLVPLALGLVSAALCAVGAWWSMGAGGVTALLHQGPRLEITNATAERLTVACTSGAAEARVGAEVAPRETQRVLLEGAPAACVVFDAEQTVRLRWSADTLPQDGAPWRTTVAAETLPVILGELTRDTGTAPEEVAADAEAPSSSGGETALPRTVAASSRPSAPPPPESAEGVRVGLVVRVDGRRRLSRGVEVWVDGERVGEAPVTWAVVAGSHEVRWFKADRLDLTCTVAVPAEGRTVLLDPEAPRCP